MVIAADASWVAILGAVTGVVALVITLVRWLREGPRLHVVFGVHEAQTPAHVRPMSTIRIVNAGGLPAYVDDVGIVDEMPRQLRVPVLRSLSYSTTSRRPLRWVTRRVTFS